MTQTADTDAPRSPRQGGGVVISVDAMGGDHGPSAIVAGIARSAEKNPDIRFIVHGPEAELSRLIARKRDLAGRCEIRDAADVVTMDDKPGQVIRNAKGTSMWSAVESVRAGEASIAVSCGNTGALMALSMIRLRKLPGVNRPAIACLWPSRNPQGFNVMLDCGADIRADATDLLQYALMGASYARNGLGVERPRVGLLNVGTEEHKGRAELKQAHELIGAAQDTGGFDYVGFVEGGDLPSSRTDVIVTDGFTGNVALKTGEGTAKLVSDFLKEAFANSIMSKIAALLAMTSLKRLQKRIDPRRVNGGVFLGLNGMVVKSHGSADATGVSAAIKLAFQLAQSGFQDRLAARVAEAAASVEDARALTASPTEGSAP
ncbi:MAG TPA: phosphate acyltransferase PlsX [Paracoccus sp. (in: a-proteobacteria)]|uniref:phosphate acyltransferase PlsX n=1 Tax=uncultured Paracoccus sp. TaxID=189685 RepID=UPI00262166FB|nr:phosphate acyltransferase PlsX [uncultured Paracoccus sp.]HMQ40915.1 phosphate acyltransferase PlsX [Paracoccus sp. (in: a-proteobacteria)]HMR36183.1 phosphate acyltransferase PlsX [Paracoccus sp. (in: a-proteobacteria)]